MEDHAAEVREYQRKNSELTFAMRNHETGGGELGKLPFYH